MYEKSFGFHRLLVYEYCGAGILAAAVDFTYIRSIAFEAVDVAVGVGIVGHADVNVAVLIIHSHHVEMSVGQFLRGIAEEGGGV